MLETLTAPAATLPTGLVGRLLAPVEGTVLMICQAFPPTGGPGVQRSAKFAKYLPRFGWRPVVWSADPLTQLPCDETLTEDLPEDLTHYTRPAWSYFSTHRGIVETLRELGFDRLLGRRLWAGLDWRLRGLLHGLSRRMVPDDQWLWVLRSVGPLLALCRREKVDVVFSTYSPAANHLLALLLQRVTGSPWVADFRDLWTDDYSYVSRSGLRRRIERGLEQTILRRADAVIGVTPSQTRLLAQHVPDQADKFVCITNGMDAEDFAREEKEQYPHCSALEMQPAPERGRCLRSARDAGNKPPNGGGGIRPRVSEADPGSRLSPTSPFILTFAGWFLSDRVDDGLIKGLARFARWVREQQGAFEFRVVGAISETMVRRFADAGVRVVTAGYLPHREAIRHMAAADLLLLPTPTGPNADTLMPGKTFEYLATGRSILLVGAPDGEAQRLVRQYRAGECVASQPESVCAALVRFWQLWRAGQPASGCAPEDLEPFTREHLTGRLAQVLDRVHQAAKPCRVTHRGRRRCG